MSNMTRSPRILIADDSEMNRAILVEMLESEYDIIEAENGEEAIGQIRRHASDLSLVLLDIVMPKMDGFEVLEEMNRNRWIEEIPVIMITSETTPSRIERAYDMGATDFISRPFDTLIVHKRVVNTILLYTKQKKLVSLVAEQIYEKEQRSSLMIDILSHIVGFRNGESSLHARHVTLLTGMFLRYLTQRTDHYRFSQMEISLISTASALHDVGKIAIDEKILNKPGRLTTEEFEIMKTHADIGSRMLKDLPIHQEEPLVKVAYEICRWHHERYDGRGYPDGLVGDQIPASAQIVALADVYDALTSERVYKPAFTHEKAVEMILGGECGAFNPLLLDCLRELSPSIPEELQGDNLVRANEREMRVITEELLRHKELTASERTLRLLEHERMKYTFFASLTKEIQFEYTTSPEMLSLSAWGARTLGLEEIIMDPLHSEKVRAILDKDAWRELREVLRTATPESPDFTYDCPVRYADGERWTRIVARTSWSPEEPPEFTGVIGKAMDIHDSRLKLRRLEQMASHDPLTGLLNHAAAREEIRAQMKVNPEARYALAILDLDHFKDANDTYGHSFGDKVLCALADRLRQAIRGGDVAARVGGDEFLIFLEYKQEVEPVIRRIYASLEGEYEGFDLSVSMGVVTSEQAGTNYDTLFQMADSALYTVKRGGRGQYRFYDEAAMKDALSAITPIDDKNDR